MSETQEIRLTREEVEALESLLAGEVKSVMIEVHRSSPNSDAKHYLQRRVELLNGLLDRVRVLVHAPAA